MRRSSPSRTPISSWPLSSCRSRSSRPRARRGIAANRVLAHAPIADELTNLLVERAGRLRTGDGLEAGIDIGPLVDGGVVKARLHVEDALERGARLVTGGGPQPGLDGERYLLPTVPADVPDEARILHEETFGPRRAGAHVRGGTRGRAPRERDRVRLAAYVFTRDLGRAHRVAEALEYGMVAVSDGALGWTQAPFGGVKGSGSGREGGRWGLEEFLDLQYLSVNF
jgi:succinate-semialdehyde dehydrogenase / glutarate-semialdehyde dehydrogenase